MFDHGSQAADGSAALYYLAANERPDLMLLDMWMPHCDGPGTVRQVRGNPRYAGMKVFSISSTSPQEIWLTTGPDGVAQAITRGTGSSPAGASKG